MIVFLSSPDIFVLRELLSSNLKLSLFRYDVLYCRDSRVYLLYCGHALI